MLIGNGLKKISDIPNVALVIKALYVGSREYIGKYSFMKNEDISITVFERTSDKTMWSFESKNGVPFLNSIKRFYLN